MTEALLSFLHNVKVTVSFFSVNKSQTSTKISVLLCVCVSDTHNHVPGNSTELPDREQTAGSGLFWIVIPILLCVCSVSVLMNVICMCVFCSRNQGENFTPIHNHYVDALSLICHHSCYAVTIKLEYT